MNLITWAKRHYWDSLETNKDLIIRHLRTFSDDEEMPGLKEPDRLLTPETTPEYKMYCGDCLLHVLERKKGEATGSHICLVWQGQYKATFQPACESFEAKELLKLKARPDRNKIKSFLRLMTLVHRAYLKDHIDLAEYELFWDWIADQILSLFDGERE
ncbi:hypothetical protein LCGC14_1369470 [marine sediment metagenome]|uniref:Uncharacterized protein n=1 Tax=marine sediment metagenome TaxID=412755 RepID=A0A0F9K673_9ZZZZ